MKFLRASLFFVALSLGATEANAPSYSQYSLVTSYGWLMQHREVNGFYQQVFDSQFFAGKVAAYQEMMDLIEAGVNGK